MDEKTLILAALLLAFSGLGLIAYASPRIEPPFFSIDDITPAQVGEVVATSGTLIKETESSGVRMLTLWDNNTIIVPLFGVDFDAELGDRVSIVGTVKVYKGALEVLPAAGRLRAEKPAPMPVLVSDIKPELKYRVVSVSGKVETLRPVTGGYIFDVEDGSGKIRVAAFVKEIGLKEGDFRAVEGMVTTYRNELELAYRANKG